jgi:hypothetical protein
MPAPSSWSRRRISAWLRSSPTSSTSCSAATTARTTTTTVIYAPPRPVRRRADRQVRQRREHQLGGGHRRRAGARPAPPGHGPRGEEVSGADARSPRRGRPARSGAAADRSSTTWVRPVGVVVSPKHPQPAPRRRCRAGDDGEGGVDQGQGGHGEAGSRPAGPSREQQLAGADGRTTRRDRGARRRAPAGRLGASQLRDARRGPGARPRRARRPGARARGPRYASSTVIAVLPVPDRSRPGDGTVGGRAGQTTTGPAASTPPETSARPVRVSRSRLGWELDRTETG